MRPLFTARGTEHREEQGNNVILVLFDHIGCNRTQAIVIMPVLLAPCECLEEQR